MNTRPRSRMSSRRHGDGRRPAVLAAALVMGLAALAPSTWTAQAQASGGSRLVIDDGHVDIGPRLVEGTWRFQLRDDTVSPPLWREFGGVALQAGEDTAITVPDGDAYEFLGEPGAQVYVLPQAQRAGVVWPGWNTQDPSVISGVSGDVTWSIEDVEGPGRMTLFLTDSFGAPSLIFDGRQSWPQQVPVPLNVHVHANWAFTETGIYRITTSMSATGKDGTALRDTQELVIGVGADVSGVPADGATTPATTAGATAGATTGTLPGTTPTPAGAAGTTAPVTAGAQGELPNTGAGYLPALVAGSLALLVLAVATRVTARRPLRVRHSPFGLRPPSGTP